MNIDPENPHASLEVEQTQSAANKAFEEAKAGFYFLGKLLAGYAPERKVLVQTMGMMYPVITEAGVAQHEATGVYNGMLKDVIILLWALAVVKQPSELTVEEAKAQAWTPSRAMNYHEKALEAAIAWGAEVGLLNMAGPIWAEGSQVFMAIVSGVSASEFNIKVDISGGAEPIVQPPKI